LYIRYSFVNINLLK